MKSLHTLLTLCATLSAGAQATTRPAHPTLATLEGVIRDTTGKPLRGAQVLVPELRRSTLADDAGHFLLDSIVPGTHQVWFRNIGYNPAEFSWPARANNRIEVAITMRPLPHTLDAVTVWANEERTMKSSSLIEGVVTDSAGTPIPGAEVALLGSGRATITDDDGVYRFRHAPSGKLTLRARLLGYTPAVSRVTLLENDERKVFLRLGRLAQVLDEVQVTARSGFGLEAEAWKEYDLRQRVRFPNGLSVLWTAEDLAKRGAQPLDLALRAVPQAPKRNTVTSLHPEFSTAAPRFSGIEGDACILENGWRPLKRPLRAYDASQIETLEYYPATPPETEWSSTIAWRMEGAPGCAKTERGHPAWYVLWFKGAR